METTQNNDYESIRVVKYEPGTGVILARNDFETVNEAKHYFYKNGRNCDFRFFATLVDGRQEQLYALKNGKLIDLYMQTATGTEIELV